VQQSARDGTGPDPLRILVLIQQLGARFGSQQLGQIMQTLLAVAFQRAGFKVVKNAVGVPDLQAFEPGKPGGYAIEAKMGDLSITLTKRDLDGVKSANRTPVVAAFFLSDPTPQWWLIDARSLRPAAYRRYELEPKPVIDVGFDVTKSFSRILAENYQIVLEGPGAVARLLGN
jgi:hypothetical protein